MIRGRSNGSESGQTGVSLHLITEDNISTGPTLEDHPFPTVNGFA